MTSSCPTVRDNFIAQLRRRTALSWIRRGVGDVVTLDHEEGAPALRVRVVNLERRIAVLTAVLRLVFALLRTSGFELERPRVPDANGKRRRSPRWRTHSSSE
jgi:hypothetical protein